MLGDLHAAGWEIGAHFGFGSWDDAEALRRERRRLEAAIPGLEVASSRNHWLRFSLRGSWRALAEAGIRVDTTLGFNDRPGFRAGLAAPLKPYSFEDQRALEIVEIPFMLMDSHLFYYRMDDPERRLEMISGLLADLRLVSGSAGVIWHSHVLSPDHGWGREYAFLLDEMRRLGLESRLPTRDPVPVRTPLANNVFGEVR